MSTITQNYWPNQSTNSYKNKGTPILNMEANIKDISFEDMKNEFIGMDEEIKIKTSEIESLRETLKKAQERLLEREDAATKMVDQMEELHENLAELDVRFERSEKHNIQLREEKEELSGELEKEVEDLKNNLAEVQNELNETKKDLATVKSDYEQYQTEAKNKIEGLQNTFKQSVEGAMEPVSSYLEKNKGSKMPIKKTKGYRLLKTVETDLKSMLTAATNNNKLA